MDWLTGTSQVPNWIYIFAVVMVVLQVLGARADRGKERVKDRIFFSISDKLTKAEAEIARLRKGLD